MRKNLLDYLVIIIAATVLFLVAYSGNDKMQSTFSFIVFIAAYVIGKAVAKHEMKKQPSQQLQTSTR